MTFICAQTRHFVSATDVQEWLARSDYNITTKSVHVYGYWLDGRPGDERVEGYWWAAEVDKKHFHQKMSLGGLRVYENLCLWGKSYKGRYFTVKSSPQGGIFFPPLERFRVVLEGKDSNIPMLSSKCGFPMTFPYTYRDMYIEARGKEPIKKVSSVPKRIPGGEDRTRSLVLEIIEKMEELKTLI